MVGGMEGLGKPEGKGSKRSGPLRNEHTRTPLDFGAGGLLKKLRTEPLLGRDRMERRRESSWLSDELRFQCVKVGGWAW